MNCNFYFSLTYRLVVRNPALTVFTELPWLRLPVVSPRQEFATLVYKHKLAKLSLAGGTRTANLPGFCQYFMYYWLFQSVHMSSTEITYILRFPL